MNDEAPPVLRDIIPQLAGATPRLRLQDVAIPVAPHLPTPEQSRAAWLRESVRYLAATAVQQADALDALREGEARRRYAILRLRQALDSLRPRAGLVIGEPAAAVLHSALNKAAPWLVQQAYRRVSRLAAGGAR